MSSRPLQNFGSLAQRLDGILTARMLKLREAEAWESRFSEALKPLESFEKLMGRLREHSDAEVASSAVTLQPDWQALLQKGANLHANLHKLANRFVRPTLNLGVVGRARQGKSTLLKSLSGLADEAIPTGRDFTTGAASMLFNDPSMQAGDARGTMHFHDESSFLRDVLHPYWHAGLGLESTPRPFSVEHFRSMKLPAEPDPKCHDPVTGATLLKELQRIQRDLPGFMPRLTGGVQDNVPRGEIRGFVAQTDAAGKALSTWRAVRNAEIRCAFPKSEAGRIALVDTPGLGQIAIGLEDYVRETLGNSLDFVLFVRLPPEQGPVVEKQDTELYNLLSRAIPELPLSDWSALVVNQTQANAPVLDIFERHVDESAMRFSAGRHRVDCTSAEATGGFLLKVLDHLVTQLPKLDDAYLGRVRRDIRAFATQAEALVQRARKAFPGGDATVVDEKALNKVFDAQWTQLGGGLNGLVQHFQKEPEDVQSVFESALNKVQEQIAMGCGLTEEVARIGVGSPAGAEIWFAECKHDLRTRLTGLFARLGECLNSIFDKMRSDVLAVLLRSDQGGRLEALFAGNQQSSTSSQWESLALLFEDTDEPALAAVLRRFAAARLSFSGFIQHRILGKLGPLSDWDEEELQSYNYPGPNAKDVLDVLNMAWGRAGQRALQSVRDMSQEVGNARWAFTLEFLDGLLRSGGQQRARDAWRILYGKHRGLVWPEVFQKLERDALTRAEWNRCLKDAATHLHPLTAA